MGVSKFDYFGTTLFDLTGDNIASDNMLSGTTGHGANGDVVNGGISRKAATDVTFSGATVTVPVGYYGTQVQKSASTATQATPTISVSDSGLITASCVQSTGYVTGGTKTATEQLTIAKVHTGSTTPSSSLGSDGDIYIKV